MLTISILSREYQKFNVVLDGQNCTFTLSQRESGLYLTLDCDGKSILQNVICLNLVKLVRYAYLGFKGDLFFYDTQGDLDPIYQGLGTRFLLYYYEAE